MRINCTITRNVFLGFYTICIYISFWKKKNFQDVSNSDFGLILYVCVCVCVWGGGGVLYPFSLLKVFYQPESLTEEVKEEKKAGE